MGFLAAGFLAAGFLAAGFLAAGFLAALAAGFLAAAFLAAGFLAGFLAAGSLTASLKEPAPFFPAAAAATRALDSTSFLRAILVLDTALAASTLLLAQMYLRMACLEDPFLSPRALMAALIMAA